MRKILQVILLVAGLVFSVQAQNQGKIYLATSGEIIFRSDAPQELIKAFSNELKGAIETAGKTFSFKVRIQSFSGFNGGLQQTHFNENYMESSLFPEATFKGKIIEDIEWAKSGKYTIRAKGMLTVHGVEQERIIKAYLTITPDNQLKIESAFTILLSDHNIPIPRVVKEKLAEEIKVAMKATLILRT